MWHGCAAHRRGPGRYAGRRARPRLGARRGRSDQRRRCGRPARPARRPNHDAAGRLGGARASSTSTATAAAAPRSPTADPGPRRPSTRTAGTAPPRCSRAWCPGPVPELVEQVAALRELVTDGLIAGIHLEGPFLSAARCGAHDPGDAPAAGRRARSTRCSPPGGAPSGWSPSPRSSTARCPAVKRLVDAGRARRGRAHRRARRGRHPGRRRGRDRRHPPVQRHAPAAPPRARPDRRAPRRRAGDRRADLRPRAPAPDRRPPRRAPRRRRPDRADHRRHLGRGRRATASTTSAGSRSTVTDGVPTARRRRFARRQHADHGRRVPQPRAQLRARRARRRRRRLDPARRSCSASATSPAGSQPGYAADLVLLDEALHPDAVMQQRRVGIASAA